MASGRLLGQRITSTTVFLTWEERALWSVAALYKRSLFDLTRGHSISSKRNTSRADQAAVHPDHITRARCVLL